MTDTREFTDSHGIAIVYDVHPAAGEPRGVVQLLHGVGEHAGRYPALIAALTGAGFHVYADDHRGHGRTGLRQHGDPKSWGGSAPADSGRRRRRSGSSPASSATRTPACRSCSSGTRGGRSWRRCS